MIKIALIKILPRVKDSFNNFARSPEESNKPYMTLTTNNYY